MRAVIGKAKVLCKRVKLLNAGDLLCGGGFEYREGIVILTVGVQLTVAVKQLTGHGVDIPRACLRGGIIEGLG